MDKQLTNEQITETQGSWHPNIQLGILNLYGMVTGCGIMQCRGVMYITKDNFEKTKKDLNDYIEKFKTSNIGVGMILCTLGETYYKFPDKEQFVLDLGFKQLSEYRNYRHSDGYRQRLYGLEIK